MGIRSTASLALANVGVKLFKSNSFAISVLSASIALLGFVYYLLSVPSRSYKDGEGTVGKEYDAWTEEGLLEYYWVRHKKDTPGCLRYAVSTNKLELRIHRVLKRQIFSPEHD
jgi:hypothetical protein